VSAYHSSHDVRALSLARGAGTTLATSVASACAALSTCAGASAPTTVSISADLIQACHLDVNMRSRLNSSQDKFWCEHWQTIDGRKYAPFEPICPAVNATAVRTASSCGALVTATSAVCTALSSCAGTPFAPTPPPPTPPASVTVIFPSPPALHGLFPRVPPPPDRSSTSAMSPTVRLKPNEVAWIVIGALAVGFLLGGLCWRCTCTCNEHNEPLAKQPSKMSGWAAGPVEPAKKPSSVLVEGKQPPHV
jgi:hypothetical protein